MNTTLYRLRQREVKIHWLVGLSAFGCGSPLPAPAAGVDSDLATLDATADTDTRGLVDSALADSANGDSSSDGDTSVEPSDAAATDVAKYPDCTLPQTKGCPCSTAELGTHCCVKVTDGLTCSKKYVDGTLIWQAFADCCRDPGHGCENINPKPTPPWCNGKIP